MSELRSIDFACNDPDNGLFAGAVGEAMVGDNEIQCPTVRPVAFSIVQRGERRAIRIHRSLFEIKAERKWFGNWCWNRFWLEEAEMQKLLCLLRDKGWRCTCGEPQFRTFMNETQAAS